MKRKIARSACFEVNSSSSHSITIGPDNLDFILDSLYPNDKGIVELPGGEFGWGNEKTNDAYQKASYVAIDKGLDAVKSIIMKQTGAVDVVLLNDDDNYIDHQSHGTSPDSEEDIHNFIFNKNSWLFISNDNGGAPDSFYNVPEIKGDGTKVSNNTVVVKVFDDGKLVHSQEYKTTPNKAEIISDFVENVMDGGSWQPRYNGRQYNRPEDELDVPNKIVLEPRLTRFDSDVILSYSPYMKAREKNSSLEYKEYLKEAYEINKDKFHHLDVVIEKL